MGRLPSQFIVIVSLDLLTKWNDSLKSVSTTSIIDEYVGISKESELLLTGIVGNSLP